MTTNVRFGSAADDLLSTSDGDFLAAVSWRTGGAGVGSEVNGKGDLRTIGLAWKQQGPAVPDFEFASIEFQSFGTDSESDDSLRALLPRVRKVRTTKGGSVRNADRPALSASLHKSLDRLLTENADRIASDSLELLACCELLILHGSRIKAQTLGRLWKVTLAGAIAQGSQFSAAAKNMNWTDVAADDDVDATVWIQAGLLPWVCGVLFDDVKGAPKLARAGRKVLNDQLLLITDETGCPTGPVLSRLSEHVARLNDALLVAALFDRSLWKSGGEERFADLLEKAASTVAADGRVCGCLTDDGNAARLLLAAAELSGEDLPRHWLACLQQINSGKSGGRRKSIVGSPKKRIRKKEIPSWQSDDAETACLRTTWEADAGIATLAFQEDPVSLELVVDGMPLFAGPWGLSIAEDGDELELEDAWECVCWYSDEDVDYCELQLEFDGGPKINRLIMLSRFRKFAVIADVASECSAERLELISQLPLVDELKAARVPGSREWRIKGNRRDIRLFPLALPQDAGYGTAGKMELESEDGAGMPNLVHSNVSESGGLFAPIVIDWSAERRDAEVEWTPLTVTETFELDRTGAGAFRLKCGKQHLVLYRAVRETPRYRTVLGYMTESETVIADFTKDGELQEILLVE